MRRGKLTATPVSSTRPHNRTSEDTAASPSKCADGNDFEQEASDGERNRAVRSSHGLVRCPLRNWERRGSGHEVVWRRVQAAQFLRETLAIRLRMLRARQIKQIGTQN